MKCILFSPRMRLTVGKSLIRHLSSVQQATELPMPAKDNMSTTSTHHLFDRGSSIYYSGKEIDVFAHTAPRPYPRREREFNIAGMGSEIANYKRERETMPPLERSQKRPPLPGGPVNSQPLRLRILEPIVAGADCHAQLMRAQAEGKFGSKELLAKIFDPMLDRDLHSPWDQTENDPFLYADYVYSRETAAYERLGSLWGSRVPTFYGSYTFPVEVAPRVHRDMRMILMEYVGGVCLSALRPARLSQQARQNILRQVIITESLAYEEGVEHDDVSPRNFLIRSSSADCFTDINLMVAMLDFECANLMDPKDGSSSPSPSPPSRWAETDWNAHDFFAEGWIDWDWRPWVSDLFAKSEKLNHIP